MLTTITVLDCGGFGECGEFDACLWILKNGELRPIFAEFYVHGRTAGSVYSYSYSYSFIANCQTAVVHKNKTKRMSKIYKINTYFGTTFWQ